MTATFVFLAVLQRTWSIGRTQTVLYPYLAEQVKYGLLLRNRLLVSVDVHVNEFIGTCKQEKKSAIKYLTDRHWLECSDNDLREYTVGLRSLVELQYPTLEDAGCPVCMHCHLPCVQVCCMVANSLYSVKTDSIY